MATINELQQEFYATQLGLSQPWPSINDLRYLFYLGVKNGNIVLGGAGGIDATAVSQQIASEVAAYSFVEDAELISALSQRPNIWKLSTPSSPNPLGAVAGDIIAVPLTATTPLLWSFTGAGMTDLQALLTSTAAPDSFGTVASGTGGYPRWSAANSALEIPNVAATNNARMLAVVAATNYSLGFEFWFGTGGGAIAPDSGAAFMYVLTNGGTYARLTLSGTGQIQARNGAAGAVMATSAAVAAGTHYFASMYGTAGTDLCRLRVRNMTDNSLFFSADYATGSTLAPYTSIFGRQSSLAFNTTMFMKRLAFASVASEINTW